MNHIIKKILLFLIINSFLIGSEAIPTEEEVAKLYVATFNRAPDSDGLKYWTQQSKLKLSQIAQSFFDQPETQKLYPSTTTNRDFIKSVYNNLFNRDPDLQGWDYWENELNKENISKNRFIEAVINGAQNDDVIILSNKTEVGLFFSDSGLSDINDARSILENITVDKSTVEAAMNYISSISDASKENLYTDNNGWFPSRILTQEQCNNIGGEWYLDDMYWDCRLKWNDANNFCKIIGGRLPTFDELSEIWYNTKNNNSLILEFDENYIPEGFIHNLNLSNNTIVSDDNKIIYAQLLNFSFYDDDPSKGYIQIIDENNTFNFRCISDLKNKIVEHEIYFKQINTNEFIAEKILDEKECKQDYLGKYFDDEFGKGCRIFQYEMENYCALAGGQVPSVDDYASYWENYLDRERYPNISTFINRFYWTKDKIEHLNNFDELVVWDFKLGKNVKFGGNDWLMSPACIKYNKIDKDSWIYEIKMSQDTCEFKFQGKSNALYYDDQRDSCAFEWEKAKNFCEYINGRLPTVDELVEASEKKQSGFSGGFYWSNQDDQNHQNAKITVFIPYQDNNDRPNSIIGYSDIHNSVKVRCKVN